jgi:hypothetical protein
MSETLDRYGRTDAEREALYQRRHEEHEARVAWLKDRLVKAEHGMDSEYRVDVGEQVRLRMFRSPLNPRQWVLVAHKAVESPTLRKYGFLFEVEGERDRDRFDTRRSVLSWIAIRWDWAIDSEMRRS